MNSCEITPSSAVVLTSSSRSGSTWLADILSYSLELQQIFEPLHPRHNATIRQLTSFDPKQDHGSSFYLRIGNPYPDWDRHLAAVLTGQVRNRWTDAVPIVQSPKGYLIKMIRANLMLGYLYDRFQPKLIYLVRHPCAVVNSRLRMGWTADVRALLKQEELVEDYLHPWLVDIEQETDAVGSHALWWAVENLVAQRELANRPHHRIFYEHLMIDPPQEILRAARYVELPAKSVPQVIIERMSRTSHRVEVDAAIAPLVSWKDKLSQEDQSRVLGWANRLGISWYGTEIWPIS
ncbi:MAG TPA: sulfotransferase [Anaerolineae bacterium]|nr:sulfotransferase [Anaerolineae bacterium]